MKLWLTRDDVLFLCCHISKGNNYCGVCMCVTHCVMSTLVLSGGRFKKEVILDGQSYLLLIRDEGGSDEGGSFDLQVRFNANGYRSGDMLYPRIKTTVPSQVQIRL